MDDKYRPDANLPGESHENTGLADTSQSDTYSSKYDTYRFTDPGNETKNSERPDWWPDRDEPDDSQEKKRKEEPENDWNSHDEDQPANNNNQYDYYNTTQYDTPSPNPGHHDRHHKKHDKDDKHSSGFGRKLGYAVAIAAVFGIVASLVFFGATRLLNHTSQNDQTSSQSAAESNNNDVVIGNQSNSSESKADSTKTAGDDATESGTTSDSESGDMSVSQVTKKVMPSMVAITNTTVQKTQDLFGETYNQEQVSAGSGIIVGETDDALLVATNNHVISGSSDITVTFDDNSAIAGTVRGADADNDLAIVAVNKKDIPDSTQKKISIVTVGDSDSTQVGEQVVAIGNALGYGQSVSSGIISAKNREVKDSDGTTRTVLQTDASINPGNSGGALLNMKGELIGINEAKLVDESVEGVGYAIPMKTAEPILQKLGNKTSREKVSSDKASYLGITCVTVPTSNTQQGYPEGVYVYSVTQNGPAYKAGIRRGDIITSLDGTSVTTKEALINLLEYYAAGEKVEVSVSRVNSDQSGFEKKKFEVTLGNKKDAPTTDSSTSSQNDDDDDDDGDEGLFSFFNR